MIAVKRVPMEILEGSKYVIRTEYLSVRWACLSVIAMNKVSKLLLALLVASLLFFFLSPAIRAQEGRIYLDFANQTVSANIREAPLKAVIKKIKSEKGVWFLNWFKGSEFLFDEKVLLRFKNIPVGDAMQRIFSGINHALIFDSQHSIEGVFLFGKSGKRRYRGRSGSPGYRRG